MRDISAIIYTSNTGFTRRYAGLLSSDAAIPAYDLENRDFHPARGTKVIYLGWLRAGGIVGLSAAQKLWRVQAVCAVGMSPENDPAVVAKHNRVECPVFCIQGGYAPEKLKGANKLAMAAVTRLIAFAQSRKDMTPEEREQLSAFRRGCDFVDGDNLKPVLSWLREESGA